MIRVEIYERLGNQLFKYAYARKLLEDRGCKDELILGFRGMKGKDHAAGWSDSLKYFNVYPYKSTNKRHFEVFGSRLQRFIVFLFYVDRKIETSILGRQMLKVEAKWYSLFDKLGIHICNNNEQEFNPYSQRDLIVVGRYENSKYFNSIRNILLKEFTPKEGLIEHNILLYNKIQAVNSVCVSIRRGDFISNPKFEKVFNICDKAYFDRAMKVIREKVENPVFIFFSDDIDWVRQNIKIDGESYYERGDDPVWEKLRLMYSCKHFIISNSTFSWWAQYLSRNDNKIVVSPTRWYKTNIPSFLIEDYFIKV